MLQPATASDVIRVLQRAATASSFFHSLVRFLRLYNVLRAHVGRGTIIAIKKIKGENEWNTLTD